MDATMDEILVHISASATRHNDDTYRALTLAYHNFEPRQSTTSGNQVKERTPSDITDPVIISGPEIPQENVSSMAHDMPSPLSTKETYGSFPSHVLSGDSVPLPGTVTPDNLSASIDQSFTEMSRLEELEHIQSNWREKSRSTNGLSTGRQTRQSMLIPSRPSQSSFVTDSQLAAAAIESQLSFRTLESADDTSEDGSVDAIEENPPETAVLSVTDSKGTGLDSKPGSQASSLMSSQPTATIEYAILPTGVIMSSPIHTVDDTLPPIPDFHGLPVQMFAPKPAVSVDIPQEWPSQVTQYLKTLQQQNSERFKPSKHMRPLEMDERGYWLVESGKWPRRAQYELWHSLCTHVKRGDFGWGISLYRDPSASDIDQVKLYCWGEIVEHTWLCLWLYSKGKVSGSSCRWFDAGDTVVVQVP